MLGYYRVYKRVTPPEMNIGVHTFQTPGDISFVFVFWHTFNLRFIIGCIHVKGVGGAMCGVVQFITLTLRVNAILKGTIQYQYEK